MSISLDEARASLEKELLTCKPTTCPCCGQRAQRYRRRLNAGMAVVLIRIYRAARRNRSDTVRIEDIFGSKKQEHRDWPLLQHWGLIEPGSKRTLMENARGTWRITLLGRLFVEKKVTIPAHHEIYDGKIAQTSKERLTILEALGKNFNYTNLMKGLPG